MTWPTPTSAESDNASGIYAKNGTSMDLCHMWSDFYFPFWSVTAICFVILAVGVVGNLLVMLTYVYFKQLKTMTDVFLFNLAAADLLYVLTLPFWVAHYLGKWAIGLFMCKALWSIYQISYFSGMLFLTCISVDRYFAITQPVKAHSWRSKAVCFSKISSVAIWAFALLFSVPEMMYPALYGGHSCIFFKGNIHVGQMVAGFLLPAPVIGFCYCAIMRTLMHARNFEKNKAIKVVFAVVAVFLLSQAPYNLATLVYMFVEKSIREDCDFLKRRVYALRITKCLTFMRCCINPFLYAFIGVKFRHNLLRLLKDLRCVMQSCLSQCTSYCKNKASVTTDAETTTSYPPQSKMSSPLDKP